MGISVLTKRRLTQDISAFYTQMSDVKFVKKSLCYVERLTIVRREKKVYKPWPRNLCAFYAGVVWQGIANQGRQIPRAGTCFLGEDEGDIARKITVGLVPGPINFYLRFSTLRQVTPGNQGVQ